MAVINIDIEVSTSQRLFRLSVKGEFSRLHPKVLYQKIINLKIPRLTLHEHNVSSLIRNEKNPLFASFACSTESVR